MIKKIRLFCWLYILAGVSLSSIQAATLAPQQGLQSEPLGSTIAQDLTRPETRLGLELKPLAEQHARSIVKISRRHRPSILGLIVSEHGAILTKLSELDETITCQMADGSSHLAVLVAQDESADLALLQIDPSAQATTFPINLTSTESTSSPGTIVVSIGFEGNVLGAGIVTTEQTKISVAQPNYSADFNFMIELSKNTQREKITQKAEKEETSAAITKAGGLVTGIRVLRVPPRTAGERIGFLVDDLILQINSTEIDAASSFDRALASLAIGESLKVKILRNGKILELVDRALPQLLPTEHDRWGGGPWNHRRFELGEVLLHDTVLRPEDCGSLLINLQGEIVGINLARSLRVATTAISRPRLDRLVAKLLSTSTSLSPSPSPSPSLDAATEQPDKKNGAPTAVQPNSGTNQKSVLEPR